jgi:hypothetical protein
LTRGWAKEAFECCPHLTDEQVRYEAAQFKDYWTSATGQKATKRDWLATWRMWVRKAGEGYATNQKRGAIINKAEAIHENNKRAAAEGVRMIQEREARRNGGAVRPADDGKTIDMDPQ